MNKRNATITTVAALLLGAAVTGCSTSEDLGHEGNGTSHVATATPSAATTPTSTPEKASSDPAKVDGLTPWSAKKLRDCKPADAMTDAQCETWISNLSADGVDTQAEWEQLLRDAAQAGADAVREADPEAPAEDKMSQSEWLEAKNRGGVPDRSNEHMPAEDLALEEAAQADAEVLDNSADPGATRPSEEELDAILANGGK